AAVLDGPLVVVMSALAAVHISADAREIVRRLLNGQNPKQIQQEMGLKSRGTIYRVMHRLGVGPKPTVSPAQRATIARMYRAGSPYREIQAAVGISKNQLTGILVAAARRGE